MALEISAEVQGAARAAAAQVLRVDPRSLPSVTTLRQLFDMLYRTEDKARQARRNLVRLVDLGLATDADIRRWETGRAMVYEMQIRTYYTFVQPLRRMGDRLPTERLREAAADVISSLPMPRVMDPVNLAPAPTTPGLRGLGALPVWLAAVIIAKLLLIYAVIVVAIGALTYLLISAYTADRYMDQIDETYRRRREHYDRCMAAGGTHEQCVREAADLYPTPPPPPGSDSAASWKDLGMYIAAGAGFLAVGLVFTAVLRS